MDLCQSNDVCLVRWVHNKMVTVASNHLIASQVKLASATVDLKRPALENIIHMGGVDKLDSYLNNYYLVLELKIGIGLS